MEPQQRKKKKKKGIKGWSRISGTARTKDLEIDISCESINIAFSKLTTLKK